MTRGFLAVDFETDGAHIILEELGLSLVALGLEEKHDPFHSSDAVIDANDFRLGRAASIEFLLPADIYHGSFSKCHGSSGVSLVIWVDRKRRINPPRDEGHLCYLEGERKIGVSAEVPDYPPQFGPVVLIRLTHPRREERDGYPDVPPRAR